jgi:mannose-6-phosphate isomerase-like protein (cupin superfamily)
MRSIAQKVILGGTVVLFALSAQQPTCNKCSASYIDKSEIEAYWKRAIDNGLVDQQSRAVDIGKANIGIGVVYRGRLDKPQNDSVAEHDLVSEVYYIVEGTATLVTGPDIVNMTRRPADLQTVREFNGPGNGGSDIRNGVVHQLKAGDVIVIPAGTGHWFTKIDDHIKYVMVRIDPDKVLPLKDEAASKAYLASPAQGRGKGKGKAKE